MLTTHLFSKNIRTQITLPRQWLHVTLNVLRSNSSSSDSSSDSDSNSKSSNKSAIGKNRNVTENSDDITSLTPNSRNGKLKTPAYLQAAKEKQKNRKIGKQLTKAAEVLTTSVELNKENLIASLLKNISIIQNEDSSKALHKFDNVESKRQTSRKRIANKRSETEYKVQAKTSIIRMLKKQQQDAEEKSGVKGNKQVGPSVLRILQEEQKRKKNQANFEKRFETQEIPTYLQKATESTDEFKTNKSMEEQSIIRTLQSQQKQKSDTYKFKTMYNYRENVPINETLKSQREEKITGAQKEKIEQINRLSEFLNHGEIFTSDFVKTSPVPELKTWNLCEERQLQLSIKSYPKNGFEEMIQWTEEGKLWKFPIDNEQGMEEEHNVHFSKHVFLERHLEEWCPTKGPIRHFMELVCNGLSKNPYMTIEEKYNHIMWYKDYFKGKQDLLQNLGLIE